MSDFNTLIAKLEAATEGDRGLDGDIALAVGWRLISSIEPRLCTHTWFAPGEERGRDYLRIETGSKWEEKIADCVPWYTTSIDAALTLVPDGWAGTVDIPGKDNGCWLDPPNDRDDEIGRGRVYAIGSTSPLALCIAALTARAA